MAVEVEARKPGSTVFRQIKHDTGVTFTVKDGELYVWTGSPRSLAQEDLVAVYGRDQWSSAVVTQ